MAKSKTKSGSDTDQPAQLSKVLLVYKDASGGEWVSAFGIKTIEISQDILDQHGEVVDDTLPDIREIFEGLLIRKAGSLLGI